MALREISGFTTRWQKNESRGEVSVGYEVDGREAWSVIHVESSSEFCLLVNLACGQAPTMFDDEENYLRTHSLDVVNEGDSVESLAARGASSTGRKRASRSATDLTDPRCLQDPSAVLDTKRRWEWSKTRQRKWKLGR